MVNRITQTQFQRFVIHQIRHRLRYVSSKDRKTFVAALKTIYHTSTLEQATDKLHQLAEKWGDKYAIAVKSWENNWVDLTAFFDFPAEESTKVQFSVDQPVFSRPGNRSVTTVYETVIWCPHPGNIQQLKLTTRIKETTTNGNG